MRDSAFGRHDRHDEVDKSLSCHGITSETRHVTILHSRPAQMSMRITLACAYCHSRMADYRHRPVHKCPKLRASAHTRAARINCGWVHSETHATFRTDGHSARMVSRRLPRHNYPRTVYLRPLFNLQLMFQIAINPTQ